ncbi:alpha/beta hydrolase [Thermoactinospora rubra]|uniref:alpha/beta hydrolase n=1 Tax=Thermoactinospora rubra TaxID=1088767 RepID=UPI001F0B4E99|nr:alpha/beta hydrolase [Thermoactinospora rubra]
MVAVTLVASVCGLALLMAVAKVTATPALFVGAGMGAFLAVGYAGTALVAARRISAARRRAARWAMFAAGSLLPAAVFAWAALVPRPASPPSGIAVPGAFQVRLATGSRLTVVKLPARTTTRRPPIIVVHGGPGVPELEENARSLAALTGRGFDVYLYAQLGTDGSARLADPRGYTRERDVADLEGLRERLGLDRVVLLGHSYGGEIAARYLAAHPGRVAKLVLTSPGPVDPADTSATLVSGRLDPARKAELSAELLAPRPLLAYFLLQVNPSAAHAFMPDAEADARNDTVVGLAQPALHCRGAEPPERPVRGTGFYAMQYPQSATAPRPGDPRPALAGLPTPALIVKGSCDYLSWRSATAYRDLLPNARLIYMPGAGHNVYHGGRTAVLDVIAAFLTDRPLPVAPFTGRTPPAGYEGPP